MKVLFKNVKWETDGATLKECGLKKRFETVVDIDYDFNTTEDEIEDKLSDWLSDTFGYCHCGFDYKIIPPKIITKDKEIKDFFKKFSNDMLNSNDDMQCFIPFAYSDNDTIYILLFWLDGYDKNENSKYVKDGYGINVCLAKRNYDFKQLSEACTMSDDFDSLIRWLKGELKRV